MKVLRIILILGLALTVVGHSGAARAATLAQEWAAVQIVVGPNWDAQSFMAPVNGATGVTALQDAGVLGMDSQTFLSDQTAHPAYLMDAIQRLFREAYSSGQAIFTVEAFNSQLGLLAVGGLTPAQEAAVLTRVCTEPFATTFLLPVATPIATPTLVPTPAPIPMPQAQGGPALFPPHATFVLPVQYGKITVVPLAPTDLPGPVKPLSRTEYDTNGGSLSYRISVFASTSGAIRSFRWQMAQPSIKLQPVPPNVTVPNLYDYSIPGFDMSAFLFRNIEIVLSGNVRSHLAINLIAYILYLQAHAFAVLEPLHLTPTPDTSGPPIPSPGGDLVIPASIAGGRVQVGYNDDAAVYSVNTPGWQTSYGPSRSYSIEPMPTDLIAQATRYDHGDDALVSGFRLSRWSFTKQTVPHPAITGERAFWVNYSHAPDSYHKGGGAYVQFVYRNLIVMVEWDVAGSALNAGVVRHALSIAQAVVDQLHHLARHK